MKDNLIKIGPALLTVAELLIAFVLLTVKSMTIAEAATEAHRRAPSSDSDADPQTYASGNTACEMLILAGTAWDEKIATATLTESTPDPFAVGALVTYKASSFSFSKRMGIIIAIDDNVAGHVASRRLAQVNWGSYGTFWDPAKNLEVVNASR